MREISRETPEMGGIVRDFSGVGCERLRRGSSRTDRILGRDQEHGGICRDLWIQQADFVVEQGIEFAQHTREMGGSFQIPSHPKKVICYPARCGRGRALYGE